MSKEERAHFKEAAKKGKYRLNVSICNRQGKVLKRNEAIRKYIGFFEKAQKMPVCLYDFCQRGNH